MCVCVLSGVVIVMQMREKLKGVMGAEMEKEILIHMLYRRFYVCAYLSFMPVSRCLWERARLHLHPLKLNLPSRACPAQVAGSPHLVLRDSIFT